MPGFIPDDYEPVEDRLRAFWSEHRGGRVTTDLVTPNAKDPGDVIVFKAYVWRASSAVEYPDATGYAHQRLLERPPPKRNGQPNVDAPEWTSPWEVAETSAIGRALANLGYAAKGKRPSREEISKASASPPPSGLVTPSGDHQVDPSPMPGDADGGIGGISPPTTGPATQSEGSDAPRISQGGEGQPRDGEAAADPNPPDARRDKLWMQLREYAGSKVKAVNEVNRVCKASWATDKAYLIPEDDLALTLTTVLKEAG